MGAVASDSVSHEIQSNSLLFSNFGSCIRKALFFRLFKYRSGGPKTLDIVLLLLNFLVIWDCTVQHISGNKSFAQPGLG